MAEPEVNDDITPEMRQAAQELGINTDKIAPGEPGAADEFEPDMNLGGDEYRQVVVDNDQYVAPLKQVFGGISMLRGAHWAMTDDEAMNISTAAVKAFPETELPPKLQFFSALIEAIGRRIFIDLAHRPENQEKDVTSQGTDEAKDPFDDGA